MGKSLGSRARQQVLGLHPKSTILKGKGRYIGLHQNELLLCEKNLRGGNCWENYLQSIYLINLEYITVKQTIQLENEQKTWIDILLKMSYGMQVSTEKDVQPH